MIPYIYVLASPMKHQIFGQFDGWTIVTIYGRSISLPVLNFFSSFLSQIAWHAHDVSATNSASVVDKVTVGCFLYDHENALDPK